MTPLLNAVWLILHSLDPDNWFPVSFFSLQSVTFPKDFSTVGQTTISSPDKHLLPNTKPIYQVVICIYTYLARASLKFDVNLPNWIEIGIFHTGPTRDVPQPRYDKMKNDSLSYPLYYAPI